MDHFLKNQTAIKLICPLSEAAAATAAGKEEEEENN